MFGSPGRAYVYLIYGYHFCVNAVCRPAGEAEAVLIRAIEPAFGLGVLRQNRPVKILHHLTNGPAKLCQALDIDRALDGADLCQLESPLLIARNPALSETIDELGPIITTTRVGITKAADLPLRYYLERSSWVSKRVR